MLSFLLQKKIVRYMNFIWYSSTFHPWCSVNSIPEQTVTWCSQTDNSCCNWTSMKSDSHRHWLFRTMLQFKSTDKLYNKNLLIQHSKKVVFRYKFFFLLSKCLVYHRLYTAAANPAFLSFSSYLSHLQWNFSNLFNMCISVFLWDSRSDHVSITNCFDLKFKTVSRW